MPLLRIPNRVDEGVIMRNFGLSSSYTERYPGVGFALAFIRDCRNPENPEGFDQFKRRQLRRMRGKATLAEISERIGVYREFFEGFGYDCPLPQHLKRTVSSGFPRYSLLLDAHFLAEMCAGILVAVADDDRFDGDLCLDVAAAEEACLGLGHRRFITKAGEIVLRDEKDIVCVLCQGADEKTRVHTVTRNVLFYAYAVPGVRSEFLEEGLALAAEAVTSFGEGRLEALKVYG
jgi:DNA/RNA-binding domain of Phe-tRNA-synthetase-like protein